MHVPPRIFRRVPYETAVRFEYDRFRGFVEEHSADLSLGGMFVKTETAPPVGTVVPIEFRLDDGYELIRGTGKVIWVREEADGPDHPAGMGLRFLELTAGSRELIFRVVERRVKQGEPTFDLEDAPAGAGARPGEDGAEPAAAAAEGELARPRWTAPPALEGTDPGGGTAVAAGAAAGHAAAAAVAAGGPAEEAVGVGTGPAEPPAEPEPWEVATPWSATPASPRWVATDPPAAAQELPEGSPDRDPEAATASPAPAPPPDLAAAAPRGPRRIGRGPAVALLLVVLGGAAAYVAQDRWLGADPVAEAGEAGPGSQVLLLPEELDPPAGGRGPDPAAVPPAGERAGGGAGDGAPPDPGGGAGAGGPAGRAALASGARPAAADLAPAAASPAPALAAAQAGPTAVLEEPSPPAGPGARRIRDITWADRDGRTDFLIWGDGALDPRAVRHFTIGGERPRLVLRIPGVDQPFARGRVEVGGGLVERIRTGLHGDRGPSELHVVFDLTGSSVRLAGIENVGGRLRVTLEGAGG